MVAIVALCFLSLVLPSFGQTEDLDSLISSVLGGTTAPPAPVVEPTVENPSERGTDSNAGQVEEGCECVPFYLCSENNTIITDGSKLLDIRIKDASCDESYQTCCKLPDTLPPSKPLISKPIGRHGCGKRHVDGVGFRITGSTDNEAQFGEFPWMIAVLDLEETESGSVSVYLCGGALIHENVILTAAHCVIGKKANNIKVRAGEWDTQTQMEVYPHQDRPVAKIITHENYYSGGLHNDVALLIIDNPFKFDENVDIICLPQQDDVIINNECYASGWGKDIFGKEEVEVTQRPKPLTPLVPTSRPSIEIFKKANQTASKSQFQFPGNNVYFKMHLEKSQKNIRSRSIRSSGGGSDLNHGKDGHYQVILKRVELPIVPHSKCQDALRKTRVGPYFKLHESFVCAGGEKGKDTCKGDGGSPLVCPIPGRDYQYQQVGIVSWGIGCGDSTPGVYVNVAKFRHWIDSHLAKYNFKSEYTY